MWLCYRFVFYNVFIIMIFMIFLFFLIYVFDMWIIYINEAFNFKVLYLFIYILSIIVNFYV